MILHGLQRPSTLGMSASFRRGRSLHTASPASPSVPCVCVQQPSQTTTMSSTTQGSTALILAPKKYEVGVSMRSRPPEHWERTALRPKCT